MKGGKGEVPSLLGGKRNRNVTWTTERNWLPNKRLYWRFLTDLLKNASTYTGEQEGGDTFFSKEILDDEEIGPAVLQSKTPLGSVVWVSYFVPTRLVGHLSILIY